MITIQVNGFDWDRGNQEKCRQHGLSLKEIEYFFQQKELFVVPDLKHSREEERYLAIGQSRKQRPMFVVFTMRDVNGEMLIRPISARFMREKEAKRYEEENANIEE